MSVTHKICILHCNLNSHVFMYRYSMSWEFRCKLFMLYFSLWMQACKLWFSINTYIVHVPLFTKKRLSHSSNTNFWQILAFLEILHSTKMLIYLQKIQNWSIKKNMKLPKLYFGFSLSHVAHGCTMIVVYITYMTSVNWSRGARTLYRSIKRSVTPNRSWIWEGHCSFAITHQADQHQKFKTWSRSTCTCM